MDIKKLWEQYSQSTLQKIKDFIFSFFTLDSLKIWFKNFRKSSADFIRSLRWTRLDTYIFKKFIISFIGSLLLFIMIYEMVQVFTELRSLPKDVKPWLLIQRYVLESFYWILILQPFSFLFATIFVLSSLAKNKELTAMVSTGTSIQRITIFLVFFSILYFILTLTVFADILIYPAYQRSEILKKVIFNKMNQDQLDRLKDNKDFSIFGSSGVLYIGNYYNAISQEITKVTVIKYNTAADTPPPQDLTQLKEKDMWITTNVNNLEKLRSLSLDYKIDVNLRIDAEKAIWDKNNKTWLFMDGAIRTVEQEGQFFKIEKFDNKKFSFISDPPEYFENIWYTVDAMSRKEAKAHIKRLKKAGLDSRDAQARYLSKYSYPFGIVMIVLAGIGIINISSRKISVVKNFFFSLMVFIVYYLFFSIGIAMASKGSVPAFMGAFTGTIILSIISITLYIRTKT